MQQIPKLSSSAPSTPIITITHSLIPQQSLSSSSSRSSGGHLSRSTRLQSSTSEGNSKRSNSLTQLNRNYDDSTYKPFDLRTMIEDLSCQHQQPYNIHRGKLPTPFISFDLIHSMMLSESLKYNETINPSKESLSYRNILHQIEELKYNNDVLKEMMMTCCVHADNVRLFLLSLRWKINLKYLPNDPSKWIETLNTNRRKYEELCIEYNDELVRLVEDNPLHTYSNTEHLIAPEHTKRHVDDPIRKQRDTVSWDIKKDIRRTKLEKLYQTCENRQMLHRVLFLYAMKHPLLNYTQGMNELIAMIFNVIVMDNCFIQSSLEKRAEKSQEEFDLLRTLFSVQHLEHDIYGLFEKLMDLMSVWYETEENKPETIMKKCNNIAEILEFKDPHLYSIFKQLDLQPQLFLMRWVRILFCQVYKTPQLYYIWDALFCHENPLSLLIAMCIIMMLLPRRRICEGDGVNGFNIYFNYKPNYSINFIVHAAILAERQLNKPIFEERQPMERSMKLERKKISVEEIEQQFHFETSNDLDLDLIYTQLSFIEHNLDTVKYMLKPDSEELDLVLSSLNELYKLLHDVKAVQTFPKRKD